MSEWAGKAIGTLAVAFAVVAGYFYTGELGPTWGLVAVFWIWSREPLIKYEKNSKSGEEERA